MVDEFLIRMPELLGGLRDQDEYPLECALALILDVKGPTPGRPGAKMLCHENGIVAGSIGGGCLEAEIIDATARCVSDEYPHSELHRFSLTGLAAASEGLACGGQVLALLAPLDQEFFRGEGFFAEAARMARADGSGTLALLLEPMEDERFSASCAGIDIDRPACYRTLPLLFERGARVYGRLPAAISESALLELVGQQRDRLQPTFLDRTPFLGEDGTPFLLYLESLVWHHAVILGAGHVARELAPLLTSIGFDCTIFDDREEFAAPPHFPDCTTIVGDFEMWPKALEIACRPLPSDSTAVIIATRGHRHDLTALEAALPHSFCYLGLLGSLVKFRRFCKVLRERGVAEESLARVITPIGVSIGARTAREIAVSVAAELIAIMNTGILPFSNQKHQPK